MVAGGDGIRKMRGGLPPPSPVLEEVGMQAATPKPKDTYVEGKSGIKGAASRVIESAAAADKFEIPDSDFKTLEAKSGDRIEIAPAKDGFFAIRGNIYSVASFMQLVLRQGYVGDAMNPVNRRNIIVDYPVGWVVDTMRNNRLDNLRDSSVALMYSFNPKTGGYKFRRDPYLYRLTAGDYEALVKAFMEKDVRELEEAVAGMSLSNVVSMLGSLLKNAAILPDAERIIGMLNDSPKDNRTEIKGKFSYLSLPYLQENWQEVGIRFTSAGEISAIVIRFSENSYRGGFYDKEDNQTTFVGELSADRGGGGKQTGYSDDLRGNISQKSIK